MVHTCCPCKKCGARGWWKGHWGAGTTAVGMQWDSTRLAPTFMNINTRDERESNERGVRDWMHALFRYYAPLAPHI